ncbi:ABC transporter permease [Metabacillus fastidiosus]|uniref:ABC transporter permease n=1 Tax=Metabacillus fastidiosus TaxID=1458 RepID=A0ABU6P329_9BACI|nr:ABC transporter permease [Metabacillus fastidiosus]MED4402894.1 ABC transporter permease [Metabacillus fastidiosus]MED4454317.1 ABC transporter permease [Metabacillus fastidiosus]
MQFSIKRVNAILMKDWKDLLKNSYIIFTLALPLIFAAWIGRIGEGNSALSGMIINLTLVIVGAFIQAAIVAEEKEKNTLRGLMLSPATTAEILIGKSALSALMTIIIIIGSIFLAEFKIPSLPLFALTILIGLIIYIAIGTILGLLSRTVMETTIIGMPVMFILGMGSMFKTMIENEFILKIMSYLPNEQLDAIWTGLNSGQGVMTNFLILLIWIVVILALTFIIYGKRRFDN